MAKKSRKYNVDGVSYVFSFNDAGNLEGISKVRGRAGQKRETPISPSSSEFTRVAESEEATSAYNIANYGGNKRHIGIIMLEKEQHKPPLHNKIKHMM